MKKVKLDNQVIWFDESLISEEKLSHAFEPTYWQQQGKIIGSAKGRGTTWFIELGTMQGALRHYRRGGIFGKLIEDSYVLIGENRSRSFQELILLKKLKKSGVNVPTPIAARIVKQGLTYSADLLSEKIPHAQDLVSLLRRHKVPESTYHRIGNEIRKMHAAQVNHTDLNIHNILIDDQSQVWIIDFDKCNSQPGDAWKQGNWDRLKRSFLKEKAKEAINWDESDWDYLF